MKENLKKEPILDSIDRIEFDKKQKTINQVLKRLKENGFKALRYHDKEIVKEMYPNLRKVNGFIWHVEKDGLPGFKRIKDYSETTIKKCVEKCSMLNVEEMLSIIRLSQNRVMERTNLQIWNSEKLVKRKPGYRVDKNTINALRREIVKYLRLIIIEPKKVVLYAYDAENVCKVLAQWLNIYNCCEDLPNYQNEITMLYQLIKEEEDLIEIEKPKLFYLFPKEEK